MEYMIVSAVNNKAYNAVNKLEEKVNGYLGMWKPIGSIEIVDEGSNYRAFQPMIKE